MAKRVAILVLGYLLFMVPVGFGHGFGVVAKVSLQVPNQLTVKLVDAGLRPVGGAAVTVAVAPGGRPVALVEGPEGTYVGRVGELRPGEAEFALEAVVDGQKHTARITLATDGSQGEITRAMSEPKAGGPVEEGAQAGGGAVSWPLLVGGAVIGGALALGVWLRRRGAWG